MRCVTRDEIVKAIGWADDMAIAEIIGTGATIGELKEAQAWIVNDEPLMNAGKPLATGRVRELIDILAGQTGRRGRRQGRPALNQLDTQA